MKTKLSDELAAVSTGLCPGCEECAGIQGYSDMRDFNQAHENGEVFDEGCFSWYECENCGSKLGGDRYVAHGIGEDGEIVHFEVCVDCLVEINE